MNTSSTALDPLFSVTETDRLTDRHLTAVAAGTAAAVRVASMLSPRVCAATVARLDAVPLDSYDRTRVDPPIVRFGPVINDHRKEGKLDPGYWLHAETARRDWVAAKFRPDPRAVVLGMFTQAWGAKVAEATVENRPLYAGLIREINAGALVHYDEVVREYPHGLFDQQVIAQLAFNVYLAVPPAGGGTTVYKRRWLPGDQRHACGYGCTSAVVHGAASVTVAPAVGDGLIFDPRHYHAVQPAQGGRRIALAFFLALTARGELVIWS